MPMSEKLLLEVFTPEGAVLRQEVEQCLAPGSEGDFGVLPGHCEFLTVLRAGTLQYRVDGESHSLELEEGFAQIRAHRILVLADRIGGPRPPAEE